MKSKLSAEEEIEFRLSWLNSKDPTELGMVLKSIQEQPFGHPGIAKAIEQSLESTKFFRVSVPRDFAAIRLMAGAALAAEWDLLGITTPIIVRQTPLYIFAYPDHKELWTKISGLKIPRVDDAYKNFVDGTLGGMQTLYERGEFPLELHDYKMHHGKSVWLSATKIEED